MPWSSWSKERKGSITWAFQNLGKHLVTGQMFRCCIKTVCLQHPHCSAIFSAVILNGIWEFSPVQMDGDGASFWQVCVATRKKLIIFAHNGTNFEQRQVRCKPYEKTEIVMQISGICGRCLWGVEGLRKTLPCSRHFHLCRRFRPVRPVQFCHTTPFALCKESS